MVWYKWGWWLQSTIQQGGKGLNNPLLTNEKHVVLKNVRQRRSISQKGKQSN